MTRWSLASVNNKGEQIRNERQCPMNHTDENAAGDADETTVYCRCAYAEVVPSDVKDQVLRELIATGRPFEAVSDLCEMSARKDPRLAELAGKPNLRITACYPRAVRSLFQAVGAPLDERVRIANMRTDPAEQVVELMLEGEALPAQDQTAEGGRHA